MTSRNRPVLDKLLTALSDPTRRVLFEAIAAHPGVTTTELTDGAATVTRWAVMKHLAVLRDAGLIQTMATGRLRRHYAEKATLASLRGWLSQIGT